MEAAAVPAAMASLSSETEETTTGPLVGAVAPSAPDNAKDAAAVRRNMLEYTEAMTRLGFIPWREPPNRWFHRLARRCRLLFLRMHPNPSSIRIGPDQPLDSDPEELEILQRQDLLGVRERLAMDLQLMKDCLDHYNRLHPDNEYEPVVLGNGLRNPHFHNGVCWTHGNFIARKKRSGLLWFLLAPRAVFFYELAYMDGFDVVVTCTPIEEPAYYTIFGFLLWWATLRSAKSDFYCKTCYYVLAYRRYVLADITM